MAVTRARHQVIDQIVSRIGNWVRKFLQVLVRESVGAARFLRINGAITRFHFDRLLDRLFLWQLNIQRNRLSRAQDKIVLNGIKTGGFGLHGVSARFDRGKVEPASAVARRVLGSRPFCALQCDLCAR